jgi:hypothetical protein
MARSQNVTRAEAARQRRHKTKEQPKAKAGHSGSPGKTAHHAPVLMRGVKAEQPVLPRKAYQMRRRYDISLGSNGAELQLPPIPLVQPSLRWVSALLVAGLVVLLYHVWHAPAYQAEQAVISGLQRLPEREVQSVLSVESRPIFSLDPAGLEHDLRLAFPEFLNVSVIVGWPNSVAVEILEREPVLGWQHAQGLVWIDQDGRSFPARGESPGLPLIQADKMIIAPEKDENDLPLVNPYIGRDMLSPKQVAGILELVKMAPEGAILIFDPAQGMGWRDPHGWLVYFGLMGEDIPEKLAVYAALIEQLNAEGRTPVMISVEHLNAAFYRLER